MLKTALRCGIGQVASGSPLSWGDPRSLRYPRRPSVSRHASPGDERRSLSYAMTKLTCFGRITVNANDRRVPK